MKVGGDEISSLSASCKTGPGHKITAKKKHEYFYRLHVIANRNDAVDLDHLILIRCFIPSNMHHAPIKNRVKEFNFCTLPMETNDSPSPNFTARFCLRKGKNDGAYRKRLF
jgi:hypothetical protein